MNERLFPFLLVLTLLDLGFVQATGVTSATAMVPMWLLAVASPWLRRLQPYRSYRAGWNTGVLVVFTLLVHHATTTGLLHMLEDGLVLAVLCQVHLLNNVGERQRPDLVFFNSFLVTFVTSFFAPDLIWSLLFVLHALVLVPSLLVNAFAPAGRPLPAALLRQLLRDGLGRTMWIGALTMLLFVAWPRDFRREGWLQSALQPVAGESGLAERVQLGDERPLQQGDAEVARIDVLPGAQAPPPQHWRTHTFVFFDGSAWEQDSPGAAALAPAAEPPWHQRDVGHWRREGQRPGTPLLQAHVQMLRTGREPVRLPLPLATNDLHLSASGHAAASAGGIIVQPIDERPALLIEYVITVASRPEARPLAPAQLRPFLDLPSRVPGTARKLAQSLREELPEDAGPLAIAAHTADWLQQNRRYQLPGGNAFARNLGEFLLGTAAGHCEYFATTLALLLRLQRVPCRLAGGYLVAEQGNDHGTRIVRARDAHAWVEVAADGMWHAFDATPAIASTAPTELAGGWFGGLQLLLQEAWAAITGFDEEQRQRWFRGLVNLPTQHPFAVLLVLAGASALVYRRRRRQSLPAIVALERQARACGLPLRCGETPRELLLRAETTALPPTTLTRLRSAVAQHEAQRYALSRSNRT